MGYTSTGIHNLLERRIMLNAESQLTTSQAALDQILKQVKSQATDPYLLASLLAGQSFVRGLDLFASPIFLSSNGILGSRIGLGAYKTFRIFGEAATFELAHRGLQVKFKGANPELLNWEGETGLRNGILHSNLNFLALHGFGKLAGNSNLVFQHTLQSTGMVTANQIAGAFNIAPASQEPLVAQLLEAEIFNMQQQGSAALMPRLNLPYFPLFFPLQSKAYQKFSPADFISQMGNENFSQVPHKIVALGDIHAKWPHVQKIMDHEFPKGNGVALAVGDLQSYPGLQKGHRLYFIPGNHDNSRVVAELHTNQDHPNYTPLLAGEVLKLGALRVAGIPGVFSPYYFAHPEGAPFTYFTPERIEAVKTIPTPIDILMMHDAPQGVGFQKRGTDLGNPLLRSILEALQPGLVLFGHHHQSFEGQSGPTRIVGLDYPKRSYVVIDIEGKSLSLRHLEADFRKVKSNSPEFQYPWERGIVFKGRKLFEGEKIMADKNEMLRETLDKKHRENVINQLTQALLQEIPVTQDNRDKFARRRALLAANTALEYAAEYAAFLDSNPQASLSERQVTLGKIYDRMNQGVPPDATPDLTRALEAYLKVLGIVNT